MRQRPLAPILALVLLAAGPAIAEDQGRAGFQPLSAGASAERTVPPGATLPLLVPAETRDVDRNGDGRIGFDELLASDFDDRG